MSNNFFDTSFGTYGIVPCVAIPSSVLRVATNSFPKI